MPIDTVQFASGVFEVEEGDNASITLTIDQVIPTPINISIMAQNGTPPLDARE